MSDLVLAFFHAEQDPSSLALFRILFGLLIVASALHYGRHAHLLLGSDGLVPVRLWRSGPQRDRFSVLRYLPDSKYAVFGVVVLHGLAGTLLSVGLLTTAAAALAFVTTVSLHHRNIHVMHSGDALMRSLCFLLIFADSGRRWSLDAMWTDSWATSHTTWALRLMQIQVAALYLQTAFFKLQGTTWKDGTASHYATRLLAHRKRRLPGLLDTRLTHRAATYGALATELAAGALVWFDQTRYYALAAAACLHLTLQVLMQMHLFQWMMLASLILFIPGQDLSAVVHFTPSSPGGALFSVVSLGTK